MRSQGSMRRARRAAAAASAPWNRREASAATSKTGSKKPALSMDAWCDICKGELRIGSDKKQSAKAKALWKKVKVTYYKGGSEEAKEFGVVAPLSAAGFGKDDVRRYAALHGLPVADKPASACLASRIPVGTEVTPERLARVETAEAGLKALGFRVLRVRHHGAHARVEVGADEAVRAREERSRIEAVLAESGFESHELAVYGQL